jgi:hypothetical protein
MLKFTGMSRKYFNSIDHGVSYNSLCCCLMVASLGVDKVEICSFVVAHVRRRTEFHVLFQHR